MRCSASATRNRRTVSLAVEVGRRGGKATARNRTAEERAQAARKAVQARSAKQRKLLDEIVLRTNQLSTASRAVDVRVRRATQKPVNP